MKIVGIENKKGDYQGRPWENYLIHCLEPDANVIGNVKTTLIKFKPAQLAQIVSLDHLKDLVGKEITRVIYDKYGNAVDFDIKG